ncbi:bZIP transcription factor [Comamonas antarctica]|uniref:bZIP transcription factor n=1 Tax=Comamonas antarctica TaxID=2743470 RepID=UPI0028ECE5FE|nr:bZIP transcription factor [Comamonas antarctica]
MTAQDQQSRADFIKHVLAPTGIQDRGIGWVGIDGDGNFQIPETQARWVDWKAAWQAARALPAGVEPAAIVNDLYSRDGVNDEISTFLPVGTKLYTASQVLAMGRVQPGWQAVPVKPTPEMAVAGLTHGGIAAALAYQDMLAAAPQPPAAPATTGPQAATTGPGGVTAGAAQDQHARDSAELRRLCQERDSARRERDLGKVEIAALESSCATLERLVDELRAKADRYDYLRERDLNTISEGGVFAGETPDNVVLNGEDLDAAIDAALKATP